jgi:biotin transport system substrate-specific component
MSTFPSPPDVSIKPIYKTLAASLIVPVLASLFIALSGQIAFYLPFTPVPLTFQTMLVLLAGYLLGWRKGMLAVLLYLAEGAVGFPVFAGGHCGVAYLFGPTGGFLIGFVLAAGLTGLLLSRSVKPTFWKTIFGLLVGNVAIYFFGVAWLSHFVGISKAVQTGLLPFVIWDLIKIGIAAQIIRPRRLSS